MLIIESKSVSECMALIRLLYLSDKAPYEEYKLN